MMIDVDMGMIDVATVVIDMDLLVTAGMVVREVAEMGDMEDGMGDMAAEITGMMANHPNTIISFPWLRLDRRPPLSFLVGRWVFWGRVFWGGRAVFLGKVFLG